MVPEHFGKGYATEAMTRAHQWLEDEIGAERTVCIIEPDNTPSMALANRLGYRRFGGFEIKGTAVGLFDRHIPSN